MTREDIITLMCREYNPQSDNNKEKSKQTCLEKYGVEYHTQVPEINAKRAVSRNETVSNPEWKETIGKQSAMKRKETIFGNEESKQAFSDSVKSGISRMSEEKKEIRSSNLSVSLAKYFQENKTMWINDGNKNKVINVNDKNDYISNGWNVGRMKKKRSNIQ